MCGQTNRAPTMRRQARYVQAMYALTFWSYRKRSLLKISEYDTKKFTYRPLRGHITGGGHNTQHDVWRRARAHIHLSRED
jgi:hypothetical protein